ncbi:regulator of protease activity HflC (stomatin/prohibitin superfamily) [Natranaerovirga pectinivora]|uniref:Regulator of protease activity HflC (Stomatin/prohibitin superfamily) n=1 Tax=Natranaerovirga pectinivora TaxID=682400 RepID=A0A4R3MP46_9FIRM|nr:SPFH domain-containing protein [Natranaerovirga pectinivora]TCT16340.1 regulator of protease activity HflC (stomatin/prohibitin superfamily) [Natranaerovirga pectinivora]
MKKTGIIIGIIFILTLIILSSSTFIVNEDEIAVIRNFGRVTAIIVNPSDKEQVIGNLKNNDRYESVKLKTEKGLHFKIPFIQSINKFTSKNLTYKSNTAIIQTRDDKKLEIAMYAQYRIIDPLVFSLTVSTLENMRQTMDNRVFPVVINSANTLIFNQFFYQNTLDNMIQSKQAELNKELERDFGIRVTDIGINRKNFPESNVAAIESKMAMQIEKERESLIAEGDKVFVEEKAKTDRIQKEIIAAALEESAKIKASADGEALKIYQESLVKDFEFYRFIERMDVYKHMNDITIFLDRDNDLLEFINGY